MVEEERKEKEPIIEQKEKTMIEEATEERKKIETATLKLKDENDRTERLAVEKTLSGKSKGTSAVQETEQERYEKRASERYHGTGLNPASGYKRRFN